MNAFLTAAVVAVCVMGAGLAPAQTPQSSAPAAAQDVPPIRNFLQVTPQFCCHHTLCTNQYAPASITITDPTDTSCLARTGLRDRTKASSDATTSTITA